jgi:hypothetical protein
VPVATVALAAGCGGGSAPPARHATQAPAHHAAAHRRPLTPEEVVLGWADATAHDLDADAARYFAPGAQVRYASKLVVLRTRADAEAFNASLPCQGRVVAMSRDGDVVTAVFVLDNRHTFACGGVGTGDTVSFTIVGGKIAVWDLLPD